MLYFIEKNVSANAKQRPTNELIWHINESKPHLLGPCIEVQADMDELDAIKAQFSNLPIPHGQRVVTWKGDMAQFIYDNLLVTHTKS